ncbi:MerR family transcriptional regulator [Microbacterium betulae]|uniref:MerR family transcriptional regulator n=1 Tax=Microbacterium betulae TaxID=2981139 RepID=A0AA97I6G1_9MICO|nr:MerR family transcriptional regulator [Microbacterium sp. AB]WOF23819.1 MerR family transcriptional regulator [Microbacterium sp. AB]
MTARWLTLTQAAEAAGRTERTIRTWIDEGLLHPADTEPTHDRRTAALAAERGLYREDLVVAARKSKRPGRPRKDRT